MIRKSFHITLAFILLVAVTGYTCSESICRCLKEEAHKSCCQKKEDTKEPLSKDCCKITLHNRINSEFISGTEVESPAFDYLVTPLLQINLPSTISAVTRNSGYYSPPRQVRDIPVLIQCFRN